MVRPATSISLTAAERAALREAIVRANEQQLIAERAKIILLASEQWTTQQIARELGIRPARVSKWRIRFAEMRTAGLATAPRTGKPRLYGDSVTERVLALAAQPAPKPYESWTGPLLARTLGDVSPDHVWRILRNQGISLREHSRKSLATGSPVLPEWMCLIGFHVSRSSSAFAVGRFSPDPRGDNIAIPTYYRPPNPEIIEEIRAGHSVPSLVELAQWACERATLGQYTQQRLRTIPDFLADALDLSGAEEVHAFLTGAQPPVPAAVSAHFLAGFTSWQEHLSMWLSLAFEKSPSQRIAVPEVVAALQRFVSLPRGGQGGFEWCAWPVRISRRTRRSSRDDLDPQIPLGRASRPSSTNG